MTRVLALDPGSELTGWALLDGETVVASGKGPNDELLDHLRLLGQGLSLREWNADHVVIEHMSPRGLPTSRQEMETLWWAGRFFQAATDAGHRVHRMTRDDVKYHHAGRRTRVNDTVMRALLIDRYGGIGGKAAAIGVKAAPGPLYGVKADAWAALALGLAWLDTNPEEASR